MTMTQETEKFTLDRDELRRYLELQYDETNGMNYNGDRSLADALSRCVSDAELAISAPKGIEVQTYPTCGEWLIVCVRERGLGLTGMPRRQIASYFIDTRDLARRTFEESCAVIERVLRYANELLPALRALQAGEGIEAPQAHRMPEVTVYHGTDGAVVVEIDTPTMGDELHDPRTVPYLRVYVNDGLIHDQGPAGLMQGSPAARGQYSDPDAPIGRLIVERSNPMEA